jgi:glycosyltransferase involved in cell wall biosynthesis
MLPSIKRVLFIDHDSGRSGSTVSLEYIVKAFRERDYRVFILTPKVASDTKQFLAMGASLVPWRKGRYVTIEMQSHFTNVRSPFSPLGVLRVFHECLKFLWGILVVGKAIRETSPHLVYVNEHVVLQASIAARLWRVPAVLHIRSLLLKGVHGIRRRVISRLILRCNSVVFAITGIEAEQLSPRGDEKKKIMVVGEFFPEIRPGRLDAKKCREVFGLPGDRPVVTMLGGVEDAKGTLIFLRSSATVLSRFPGVLFVIAGRIEKEGVERRTYYEECMELVEPLRKDGSVRLLGEIANPLELIAASDVIVSPSTMTHFSRPVIEAWGCGRPVIASGTDHMRNLIEHGVNGLLFDSGDHEALAHGLCRLLGDAGLRERLGEAGARKVSAEFNARENLRTIVEVCDSLIEA